MREVTITGIDGFKSRMIRSGFNPSLQPNILMTTVHDSYLAYGADVIIDSMKWKTEMESNVEHVIRFSVDGLRHICVEITFTGSFSDEQYKVIKFLIFLWFKALFGEMFKNVIGEEMLIKEMDLDYYERNSSLLSYINIT